MDKLVGGTKVGLEDKVIIKTLGSCSIACRDKIISDEDISSKNSGRSLHIWL